MFNNQQYASNVLIEASLSNDEELIDLTKKISEELHIGVDVICAIGSYLNSLKAKNATRECVQDSKYFLNKLTQHLYGIHPDGVAYRRAVEALILNVEIEDKAFCINLAREFYPLWLYENQLEGDHAHIAKLNIHKDEFIDLWKSIDQEFFSDMESWPLALYTESMRKIGVSEKDVNIRLKIAKVITIKLRNDHSSPDENYRDAINRTQHLFSSEEMKEFYLIVSREFYHFWIG
ncbi:MAG: hypothetical protein ABIP37_00580 [Methylotenera sp.]